MLVAPLAWPDHLVNLATTLPQNCSTVCTLLLLLLDEGFGQLPHPDHVCLTWHPLAAAVAEPGAGCFGFTDATICPCTCPKYHQQVLYMGGQHALKYQGVVTPEGASFSVLLDHAHSMSS